jgi:hypothetical protein
MEEDHRPSGVPARCSALWRANQPELDQQFSIRAVLGEQQHRRLATHQSLLKRLHRGGRVGMSASASPGARWRVLMLSRCARNSSVALGSSVLGGTLARPSKARARASAWDAPGLGRWRRRHYSHTIPGTQYCGTAHSARALAASAHGDRRLRAASGGPRRGASGHPPRA